MCVCVCVVRFPLTFERGFYLVCLVLLLVSMQVRMLHNLSLLYFEYMSICMCLVLRLLCVLLFVVVVVVVVVYIVC